MCQFIIATCKQTQMRSWNASYCAINFQGCHARRSADMCVAFKKRLPSSSENEDGANGLDVQHLVTQVEW